MTLAAQHLCLCGAPDSAIQTGQSMRAEIAFISQATRTDPKIQGVNVFNMTQAEGGVLPGMNVLASLLSDKIIDGITVPASAIVWWQDRASVYRRIDSDSFTRTDIATDLPTPDGGYIVSGLPKWCRGSDTWCSASALRGIPGADSGR